MFFLRILCASVVYNSSDYYQKGVMITGKEKIFSGKEVSDEERISLAENLLGKHIEAASKPGTNIAEAITKGLSSFVTDMVVNTPVNVVKDTTNLASYGIEMLVIGAIKTYSSMLNTEYNQSTVDKIVRGITLPLNVLNDAMQIYNNTAKYLTLDQIKNIIHQFISHQIKVENPGLSTTTFTGPNEQNSAEFKEEVEKAKNIISEAMKTAGEAGKGAVVDEVIKALDKAGYTLAASTLKGLMLVDVTGAFEAISLSDPTDVAGLLGKQGEEFIKDKLHEISLRKFNYDPLLDPDAELKLKMSVNQAIESYLTSINYANNYMTRLVFPEIKFDFEKYMGPDYWVEQVILKQ